MGKIFKRTMATIMVVLMVLTSAPLGGLVGFDWKAFAVDDSQELILDTDDAITRAEWLHNLAVVFEMTVEDEIYPDNYFSDLEDTHEYYYDVLLNVNFGVIDIEAGEAVQPDAVVTRSFASQTLNFCLGFQLEEETYTFTDSGDCVYPHDAQVAVNRGWFELVYGKFSPDLTVSDAEVKKMLDDAQDVREVENIDYDYDSSFDFEEYVVEIPQGTEVNIKESVVTITDFGGTLKGGDVFAVYYNGIPQIFEAKAVSSSENVITVEINEDFDGLDLFTSVDAQGVADADTFEIIPAEDAELDIDEYEEISTTYSFFSTRKVVNLKKSYTFTKKIDLGDGLSFSVSVKMKDPKVDYNITTSPIGAYVSFEGDAEITYSGKFDLLDAFGLENILLGTIGVPGIGGISFYVDLELEGAIKGTTEGYLNAGVSYSVNDGFRAVKNFKSTSFTISAEASGAIGLIAKVGITDAPVINAYAFAKIGGKAEVEAEMYLDGKKPHECASFAAYLYASMGFDASIKFLSFKDSFKKTYTWWDKSNSPARVVKHYEDGVLVAKCTRDIDGTKSKYHTWWGSSYGGSGWSGGSESVGYGRDGTPYKLYDYTLDDDGNATITKYYGNATALYIPETIDGHKVVAIGSNSFKGKDHIRSVIIPDSVTSIGFAAFKSCENLSKVTLSKGLIDFSEEAFAYCNALTSIEIPKSLTTMNGTSYNSFEPGVFYKCQNLKTVTFETGTTKVVDRLFANCLGLESIAIPDTVTIIESEAFLNCQNLKEIKFSNSLTNIGSSAFKSCTSLENIVIPDSVTSIGFAAFKSCENLSKVTLSKGLIDFSEEAFAYCNALTSIEIPKSLTTMNGTSYNSFEPGVFYKCQNLKTVTFETGTTKVVDRLFANCPGLESVTIPDTVTVIEGEAFLNCQNLKNVVLPGSLETINTAAFKGCSKLQSIIIPNTVTGMGESVFRGCTSLKSAKLPNIRVNIPSYIFADCSSLEKIEFPSTIKTVQTNAFLNCTSLKEIVFNDGLESINESAFKNCDALTAITIPNSVTSFGSSVFYDCDTLTSVTLGTGSTSLPASTFEHCDALVSVDLPYRTASIGNNAFKDCVKFTTITIPRATTSIASNAFSYPSRLTINGVAGTYAETFAKEIGATFVDKQVNATAVTVDKHVVTLNKGQKTKLVMAVTPSDFTDEVVWKSSNTDIVTITDDGTLTAKAVGTATIKLTVGNVSASCKVTVVQPVTSIYIDKSSVTLQAHDTYQLNVDVNPDNAANKSVVWSSSAEDIASVDQNGLVTAYKKGETTIRVDAQDGSNKYDTCKIIVSNNGVIANDVAQLESTHNYPVNCTDFWKFTSEGAANLEVTFDDRTNIEDGFDYLYIYDGEGNEVGKYTGTELSGKTITVSGDTVRIQLNSDDSGTEWGFKVTEVKIASAHIHSYSSKTTESPSCTKTGTKTFTCACGDTYTETIAKLGHSYSSSYTIDKKATCSAEGSKSKHCTRSGCTAKTDVTVIENQPHTFTEQIIDSAHLASAATTESPAIYKYDCATCDAISEELTFTYGEKLSILNGKPESITVTQSTCEINLIWTPVDGVAGYRVYLQVGSKWKALGNVVNPTATLRNLTSGTKYTYAVQPIYRIDGKLVLSDSYSTIATATKTAKPAKVSATQSTSAIKLSWNAVNGADGYKIFYKVDGKWKTTVSSTTATSHTFRNLKAGAKYTFAIQPYAKVNGIVIYGEYAEYTAATLPATVTAKAVSSAKGKITLSWNQVSGSEGYQIWYKKGDGSYKLYKTVGTSTKSFSFSNLPSGTKYTFAVRAGIKTSGGNIFGAYKATVVTVK